MLNHANRVARERREEAIGWLLGYFAPGRVTVLDSVGATRYMMQSRYGAQADPREELEIATSYPRNVGIVGLYHSHPFRDETQHAIFHSQTDDATLKSRASRQENYLSIVTDGRSAECFVLRDGRPVEVAPAIEEVLFVAGQLHKYSAAVAPSFSLTLPKTDMAGVVATLERRVSTELDRAVKSATVRKDTVTFAALAAGATRNRLVIEPSDGRHRIDLSLRLELAVFVAERRDEEVLRAMRNEILDDVVFLLWRGFDAGSVDLEGVERFEANLGSLRVHETSPLPRKLYRPSKRGTVLRRRA